MMQKLDDWRIRDEDLPDIPPGRIAEREITPQKHVTLRKIAVHDMRLARLRIGAVIDVPFEICGEDGTLRLYRPIVPAGSEIARFLEGCGAKVVAPDAIWVCTGMFVLLTLENDRTAPAKPRASLLVQEELP